MPWLAVAAFIAVADQGSKHGMGASLRPGEVREITGFFNLVLAYNRGAAFSFLSDAGGWQRVLFIGIAAIAVAVIVTLLARHPGERLFCAGLALILGGALGNVWDRVALGHVLDFLDVHAFGWHFWAFNVAELAEVPSGSTVIFSAHGVSKAVRGEAASRGLRVFDATCPLVTKVHVEVAKMRDAGREIVMIGHRGHPEVEGTMGQSTEGMHLVEATADVARLQVRDPLKLSYVTQTTLSVDDAAAIVEPLRPVGAGSVRQLEAASEGVVFTLRRELAARQARNAR